MDIPFAIFAAVYLLLVIITAVIGLLYFGLVMKYGMRRSVGMLVTMLLVVGFVVIIGGTIFALRDVDWSSSLNLSVPGFSTGPTS